MSILDLFKNLKLIVTVLVILGLGAFAYIQHGQVNSAREESKTAKMERDTARADRDKAIIAAKENADTVKSLLSEREEINKSFETLRAEQQKIRILIGKLDKIIIAETSNPANFSPVQPVISRVITDIQEERAARWRPSK